MKISHNHLLLVQSYIPTINNVDNNNKSSFHHSSLFTYQLHCYLHLLPPPYIVIICRLDESIFETIREQSTAGAVAAKDISDAKASISELGNMIDEIKRKAKASETMVKDTCRDIKFLEIARTHLEITIHDLTRLEQLYTLLNELRSNIKAYNYSEVALHLEPAIQSFARFLPYISTQPRLIQLDKDLNNIKK